MAVVVTLTKLTDRKAANSVTGNSVAANSELHPFMLLCRFGPRAGLAIPRQTSCGQIGGWVVNGHREGFAARAELFPRWRNWTTKSDEWSYQTYRHARPSTITARTIIKLISAHKLSVRLLSLLSLRMVMTSLQDASPTVNLSEGAHEQEGALI
jgi:hypothetical protein